MSSSLEHNQKTSESEEGNLTEPNKDVKSQKLDLCINITLIHDVCLVTLETIPSILENNLKDKSYALANANIILCFKGGFFVISLFGVRNKSN